MSLKSWVLGGLERMNGLVARGDLPAREPTFHSTREPQRQAGTGPAARDADSLPSGVEDLGAYGPLIGAIRDELQHFVVSQVRLHLAIADRDRFVLVSIGVRCAAEAHPSLQQFMREFKPEQVKRYLARDVIGGLPNAAAIDLTQFAGLFDAAARDAAEDASQAGEYRELLEALRSAPPSTAVPAYQVSIVGRWNELDAGRPGSSAQAAVSATPTTPLAGQRWEFDIEDGDGRRRVVLQAVVPGRRYVVGKGEGCDIRISGTYTSRRHAELWRDNNAWWVTDAGSANGIRVESMAGVVDRSGPAMAGSSGDPPIRLVEGARLVMSARAEGTTSEYPWVALRSPANAPARITPIAPATGSPKTPLTTISAATPEQNALKITAFQVGGVRTLELLPSSLPVTVGRSRNQTLMVDRRHEGVSGHHLEITELDEAGAHVVVHGDNGVLIDGVCHTTGAHLHWAVGETMVLGASASDHPTCTLTLTHRADYYMDGILMAANRSAPASLITPLEPCSPYGLRAVADAAAQESIHATALRRIEAAVTSSCGNQHPSNEDAHSALGTSGHMFVVADGVGGGAMAQLASRELVLALHEALEPHPVDADRVRTAMLEADRRIARRIAQKTDSPGAATVALCAPVNMFASKWLVAWVGDCRVYRLAMGREPRFDLLTRDDTFRHLEEAPPCGGSPDDPARMVGNGATTGANIALHDLACDDLLVLCSDGVHKYLQPDDWCRLLDQPVPLVRRCEALVALARVNGSVDDATVLLLRRAGVARPRWLTRFVGSVNPRRFER